MEVAKEEPCKGQVNVVHHRPAPQQHMKTGRQVHRLIELPEREGEEEKEGLAQVSRFHAPRQRDPLGVSVSKGQVAEHDCLHTDAHNIAHTG